MAAARGLHEGHIPREASPLVSVRLRAERLSADAGRPDVTVLVLPRGGVPVAFEDFSLMTDDAVHDLLPRTADFALAAIGD